YISSWFFCSFFFQAEDGIRDDLVTGVQTCALPILRALGFGGPSVVFSFLIEALLISFVGGLLGCLAVLRLNGVTTSTINFQTFSNLAFAFMITPSLLVAGVVFALVMRVFRGFCLVVRCV